MGSLARQNDFHAARSAIGRAVLQPDMAERNTRHIMLGEAEIRRQCGEFLVGDDGCSTGAVFFCRLKQQDGAAAFGAFTAEHAANGGKRRHMAVMAAHVALAGNFRSVIRVAEFLDRQGVEFGADHHGLSRCAAVIDYRHAGSAKSFHNRVWLGLAHEADDFSRSLHLFSGDFRHGVKMAAPGRGFDYVVIGERHERAPYSRLGKRPSEQF
ncbi:hypothetical protein D3C73_677070 [compost metagenome]